METGAETQSTADENERDYMTEFEPEIEKVMGILKNVDSKVNIFNILSELNNCKQLL